LEHTNRTIEYTYDAFGNLKTQTDANGNVTTMYYDILNRLISKEDNETTTTYTYDTQPNGIGLIATVSDSKSGIVETYNYDNLTRLVSQTTNYENKNYTYSYTFDNLGRTETETYPSGFKLKNSYNSSGYLDKIYKFGDYTKPIWQLNEMNYLGQITRTTAGNGIETEYGFDATNHIPQSIKAGNAFWQTYNFEAATGNLLSRKDNMLNKTETFTYDNLQRLHTITQDGVLKQTINYAANGNIDTKTDVGKYLYSPTKPHAVTQVANTTSMIPSFEQNIEFNNFNKIAKIEENTHKLTFDYGIDHQRIKTQLYENNLLVKTKYFLGSYEKEVDATGKVKEINYISTPTGLTAVYIKDNGKENIYYLHQDYLGSICAITDKDKNVVEQHSYDAWGRTRNIEDWTYDNVTAFKIIERGYTTHEHLTAFNLINMNGRLYDPILCRMLSPDNYVQSAGYSQSFNRYSYCWNNPLKYTDPSGNMAVWDDLIVASVGFAVGYVSYGLKNDSWGWKAVGAGLVGAATFMVGYYTGGTAAIANEAVSWGYPVAANIIAAQYAFGLAMTSIVNNYAPTYTIPIYENTTISFQPSITPNGLYISSTIVYTDEYKSFAFGVNTNGNWYQGISFHNKKGGYFSWYKTQFKGDMAQGVGGYGFGGKNWSVRIDEDHFFAFGDCDDRYRTGGFEVSIYKFMFGGRVMTNDIGGQKTELTNKDYYNPVLKKVTHPKKGAYVNGIVLDGMGWVGYKSDYGVVAFEQHNPIYQHIFQNGIHRIRWNTPYFQSTPFNYYKTNVYRQNPFTVYFY